MLIFLLTLLTAGAAPKAESPREAAAGLARDASALLEAGKSAEAETKLNDAQRLDPSNPNLAYQLACVHARLKQSDDAMDDLEHAARLGFTDFPLIARDPNLQSLHELARFRQLLDRKDQYLQRTAEGTLVALRNRFGPDGYRYEIDAEHRLIFAVAGEAASFDELKTSLVQESDALDAAVFAHGLDAYVTVLLPTAADYGKMVRFRNVPGLYVDATKSLVARERGFVLSHEFAHALHAADQNAVGQKHATWVSEGFGVLCEAADFGGGRFSPRDNPRFAALPSSAKRKALIPLERLVAMPQEEFVKRPNLTYGQSGYLLFYLWDQKLLRKFYDTYKSTYARDASGRIALETVCGKPLPDVQEEWRLWLAARAGNSRNSP